MQDKKILQITFGALADPLSDQLEEVGITVKPHIVKYWQQSADAIFRLNIRGLLPDGQTRAARKRLLKMMIDGIEE